MERPKNTDKKVRTWLCTLNNPSITLEEVHRRTEAAYTVGQMEQGDNGTPHLQFVQNFKNPVRLAHFKSAYRRLIANQYLSTTEQTSTA